MPQETLSPGQLEILRGDLFSAFRSLREMGKVYSVVLTNEPNTFLIWLTEPLSPDNNGREEHVLSKTASIVLRMAAEKNKAAKNIKVVYAAISDKSATKTALFNWRR